MSFRVLYAGVCFGVLLATSAFAQSPAPPPIRSYIDQSWNTLSRSMSECKSVVDSKVTTAPILFVPADLAMPADVLRMQQQCKVDVRRLPRVIHHEGEVRTEELTANGLLYLPNRYVVPGGRFNEMYGWDTYFILLGLVADGRVPLAKGIVENFFFEIEHYGAVLNANRTYFFTRSQPPFLSSMIREVYEHQPAPDKTWLSRAYTFAQRDYALWTTPEHRAGDTGLARYFDLGAGPVPEMADDSSYYPDVIRWMQAHPEQAAGYLVPGAEHPSASEAASLRTTSCDVLTSHVCAQAVVNGQRLSAAYFQGDRAMRESGFDTSFRFGPFSGSTEDYAPVCLNSLLYKYELDLAHFAAVLGKPAEQHQWEQRAAARKAAIDKYLWSATKGMYFDYDFATQTQSSYAFITTFYPLWAGAASPVQAAAVHAHLATFEHGGGLAMSDVASGVQWDLPFGWAPTNWLAVAGLDRYGFHSDAVRTAGEFSKTVLDNYLRDGTIREKYNVVDGSNNIKVAAGYRSNVIGFGWTNGVYLKMSELINAPATAP